MIWGKAIPVAHAQVVGVLLNEILQPSAAHAQLRGHFIHREADYLPFVNTLFTAHPALSSTENLPLEESWVRRWVRVPENVPKKYWLMIGIFRAGSERAELANQLLAHVNVNGAVVFGLAGPTLIASR
ncbi:MAG: hypothetical protein Kow00114_22760 [Kiloniellaceae bacterium]